MIVRHQNVAGTRPITPSALPGFCIDYNTVPRRHFGHNANAAPDDDSPPRVPPWSAHARRSVPGQRPRPIAPPFRCISVESAARFSIAAHAAADSLPTVHHHRWRCPTYQAPVASTGDGPTRAPSARPPAAIVSPRQVKLSAPAAAPAARRAGICAHPPAGSATAASSAPVARISLTGPSQPGRSPDRRS